MKTSATQQTPEPVEKLAYTSNELCRAIGISPTTLWRLQVRGLLRPVPGLRHRLWPVAEVNRFLHRSN